MAETKGAGGNTGDNAKEVVVGLAIVRLGEFLASKGKKLKFAKRKDSEATIQNAQLNGLANGGYVDIPTDEDASVGITEGTMYFMFPKHFGCGVVVDVASAEFKGIEMNGNVIEMSQERQTFLLSQLDENPKELLKAVIRDEDGHLFIPAKSPD